MLDCTLEFKSMYRTSGTGANALDGSVVIVRRDGRMAGRLIHSLLQCSLICRDVANLAAFSIMTRHRRRYGFGLLPKQSDFKGNPKGCRSAADPLLSVHSNMKVAGVIRYFLVACLHAVQAGLLIFTAQARRVHVGDLDSKLLSAFP